MYGLILDGFEPSIVQAIGHYGISGDSDHMTQKKWFVPGRGPWLDYSRKILRA